MSAIKRQMISDGAIRIGELHFAGPVPDESDYPTEFEGKWGVDGKWMDPKLLIAGSKQEQDEMGAQDEGREMPFEIRLSGQKVHRQRRTTSARKRFLTHAAVGRVESTFVHDDDRTR